VGNAETPWGGRKVVAEMEITPKAPEKGYTRETLYVHLGTGEIRVKPVTDVMIDRFIGGRGFDLYLTWQAVGPDTKWDDPENEICISSGPLGGTGVSPHRHSLRLERGRVLRPLPQVLGLRRR
jgi:aldehyde:ferredoxin oxidoreductase